MTFVPGLVRREPLYRKMEEVTDKSKLQNEPFHFIKMLALGYKVREMRGEVLAWE